jgi:hypothetical protein
VVQSAAKRPREIRYRRWVASLVKVEKFMKVATEKELYEASILEFYMTEFGD